MAQDPIRHLPDLEVGSVEWLPGQLTYLAGPHWHAFH